MVDFVRRKASQALVEDRDVALAVDGLVLDMQDQGPRDHAPYVEEAEAAFVLLVGLRGLLYHARIEQRHGFTVGPRTMAAARLNGPQPGVRCSGADGWGISGAGVRRSPGRSHRR